MIIIILVHKLRYSSVCFPGITVNNQIHGSLYQLPPHHETMSFSVVERCSTVVKDCAMVKGYSALLDHEMCKPGQAEEKLKLDFGECAGLVIQNAR